MTSSTKTPPDSGDAELIRPLAVDPALRETIPAEDRELADQKLLARCVRLDRGPWNDSAHHDPEALGILVTDGLLTRELNLAGTRGREILGPGDVLRPWDDETHLSPLGATVSWTTLEPARVALLDHRWVLFAGRWPDLGLEILSRVMRRARSLLVLLTIAGVRGVEDRVMLFLWHLASNWGRVTPDGTLIPFPLTHEVIADVIGVRRPSVSTAVSELQRRGDLERADEGWLLHSPPPGSDPLSAG